MAKKLPFNWIISLLLFLKSFQIKENDFIVPKNRNLFIGALTGRTGTSWLVSILRATLRNSHVLIGENGSFVLAQFRNAAYEYYQGTPGTLKNKKSYLNYFGRFMTHEAYKRRTIYGGGLPGLSRILPRRAIKLALNALETDLQTAQDLQQCNICFGKFYSRLFNIHSLIIGGNAFTSIRGGSSQYFSYLLNIPSFFLRKGTINWISKEPAYGRHINELFNLIPDCRVVVMIRDGRDTALSMAKKHWHNGKIIDCIDRWRDFTEMTLDSLKHVPTENYMLIKYEQMLLDLEETIYNIIKFYGIEYSDDIIENIEVAIREHASIKNNSEKWKRELNRTEIEYFEKTCTEVMEILGYKV